MIFRLIFIKMSQARFASCIPLPIEHKNLVNVIEKAKDWALMHGVAMRDKNHFSKDVIQVFLFYFSYNNSQVCRSYEITLTNTP